VPNESFAWLKFSHAKDMLLEGMINAICIGYRSLIERPLERIYLFAIAEAQY
jgi:hypothetical protein